MSDADPLPRWAQLSYASFDTGQGAGGWQVKQTTGDLSTAEREALLPGIVTGFDAHRPLPQFPGAADIAAAPRRFSYVRTPDGEAVYWHAVQAGNDSTGRPGNVFSHIVIDRDPSAPAPALRPVEMWRSNDLLAPFGADQVLAATFDEQPYPRFGEVLNSESTQSFLFDSPVWRVGVLCVLLDALAEAFAGGRRVVIGTESVDTAAAWMDAVSHLTSSEVTRRMSFSLYERAASLDSAWSKGVLVAAVPLEELEQVKKAGVIVIDESESPVLGSLDGQDHGTIAGSAVAVTEWSEMAQIVLIDPDIAREAMTRIDTVAERVGDSGLAPAWPLAMLVSEVGEGLEDALPAARRVILRSSPAGIKKDQALFTIATAVTGAEAGVTASDAWHALQQVEPERSPITYELLRATYLQRAVDDADWLTQPGAVPLPVASTLEAEPSLAAAADAALRRALESDDRTAAAAILHLRLVDLLLASNILDATVENSVPSPEIAIELLAGSASQFLAHPNIGPEIVNVVGNSTATLRSVLVREAIESSWPDLVEMPPFLDARGPGQRSAPEVVDWLCADLAPEQLEAKVRASGRVLPLDLEFAIAMLRSHDRGALAAIATRGTLNWYGQWDRIPDGLRSTIVSARWTAADAAWIEETQPGQLPTELVVRVFVQQPWNDGMQALLNAVARRPADSMECILGRFRRNCFTALHDGPVPLEGLEAVDRIVQALAFFESSAAWEEIAPYFLALMLAMALSNPRMDHLPPNAARLVTRAASAASAERSREPALALWRAGGANLDASALLGLITAPDFPIGLATPLGRQLAAVVLHGSEGDIRLTELPIRTAVVTALPGVVETLPDRVNGIVVAWTGGPPDDKRRERALSDAEKFARGWWRSVGVGGSRLDAVRQNIIGALRPHDNKEK